LPRPGRTRVRSCPAAAPASTNRNAPSSPLPHSRSLPAVRLAALQDEKMVRYRVFFGTSKGVDRIGNLLLFDREEIPI
jgi:hypothetical protein